MSDLLSDVIGAAAGGAAGSNPISVLGGLADDIVNAIWPDPVKKEEAQTAGQVALIQAKVQEMQVTMQQAMAQIAVDTAEANNSSMFVAGARPFILWVCGFAFAYTFLLEPMMAFVATTMFSYKGTFPVMETGTLMSLTTGMLGLTAARTYEHVQGAATKAVSTALPWLNK